MLISLSKSMHKEKILYFVTVTCLFIICEIFTQSKIVDNLLYAARDRQAPNFIPTVEHLNFTADDDDDDDGDDGDDGDDDNDDNDDDDDDDDDDDNNTSATSSDGLISKVALNNEYQFMNETLFPNDLNHQSMKMIDNLTLYQNIVHDRLPYPISMLQNIETPLKSTDVPFFWHVPKAGGSSVKDIVHRCYGLTRSQPIKSELSLEIVDNNFLNVNLATPEGIEKAKELKVMESNLLQLVVSSYLFKASELFSPSQKGRMFTMLRHPVEISISLFYYLGTATWEKEYDQSWSNMTLMEFAQSNLVRENWMTRYLTDELEAPLTHQHVAVATQILAEKCIIGLIDKMEESIKRFETYFGWKLDKRGEKCLARFLKMRINKNEKKNQDIHEDSKEWKLLLEANEFDIALYKNARELYKYQTNITFAT